MRKSQFIFVLMLSTSFATMARADDDTSFANCVAAVGAANAANCVPIGDSDTYYALSGDAGNQTMTIYGTSGSTAATVPVSAFYSIQTDRSTLPRDVKSLKTSGNVDIGDGAFYDAFYGDTGLTSVDLTGVQTIGDYAFFCAMGCDRGLTSVDLTGVQSIGDYAFYGARGLTSVDLTGVQSIGDFAFYGDTGLTSIVISDSLLDSNGDITGIYDNAFEESGLSTIYCPTDKTCGNNLGISGDNIISYSKNEDGTFTVGDNTYANAYMMTKDITCEGAQCTALRTALDAGGTCSTQDACNTLALQYATPSEPEIPAGIETGEGGSGENTQNTGTVISTHTPKRIYTVEEAAAISKPTGNTFKLRYK